MSGGPPCACAEEATKNTSARLIKQCNRPSSRFPQIARLVCIHFDFFRGRLEQLLSRTPPSRRWAPFVEAPLTKVWQQQATGRVQFVADKPNMAIA